VLLHGARQGTGMAPTGSGADAWETTVERLNWRFKLVATSNRSTVQPLSTPSPAER
jgi:hypothetical protein